MRDLKRVRKPGEKKRNWRVDKSKNMEEESTNLESERTCKERQSHLKPDSEKEIESEEKREKENRETE